MKYQKGYKYQLAKATGVQTSIYPPEDIKIPFATLFKDGYFRLFRGYACDGASGPTIDTPGTFRGAFFHDAGYQMLRLEKLPDSYREEFDKLALRLWTKDMKWKWRAKLWYRGVRSLAGFAADPKNRRKIFTAP